MIFEIMAALKTPYSSIAETRLAVSQAKFKTAACGACLQYFHVHKSMLKLIGIS